MRLTDQQYNRVAKASKDITLKRGQAQIGFMMGTIMEPEVTRQIIRRRSIYLTLYAWVYYKLCIEGTGLGKQDAANHFFALFLEDEGSREDDKFGTMTGATLEEANELKNTCPKLALFLLERAQNDFQGGHQDFHATLKRAFEIETHEQKKANQTHALSCPFCAKTVQVSNVVEKTAFRCPHCNQVFNVQP